MSAVAIEDCDEVCDPEELDTVLQVPFAQIPRERIIRIRLGNKLNCYDVEGLYGWIQQKQANHETVTEPISREALNGHQIRFITEKYYKVVLKTNPPSPEFYEQKSVLGRRSREIEANEEELLRPRASGRPRISARPLMDQFFNPRPNNRPLTWNDVTNSNTPLSTPFRLSDLLLRANQSESSNLPLAPVSILAINVPFAHLSGQAINNYLRRQGLYLNHADTNTFRRINQFLRDPQENREFLEVQYNPQDLETLITFMQRIIQDPRIRDEIIRSLESQRNQ